MIQPNMATMLAFVMTDAVVKREDLNRMLTRGVERSFHSLTVDGDTSTNDTLLLLANGASNVRPRDKERDLLAEAVARVMERLAQQIAADGEGARKLIIVRTSGFRTKKEASRIGRAVANSPLVKTAIAGSDPNWGRIWPPRDIQARSSSRVILTLPSANASVPQRSSGRLRRGGPQGETGCRGNRHRYRS